jgi:hypothetical protein
VKSVKSGVAYVSLRRTNDEPIKAALEASKLLSWQEIIYSKYIASPSTSSSLQGLGVFTVRLQLLIAYTVDPNAFFLFVYIYNCFGILPGAHS